jgi:hypothetical protein
MGLLFLLAAHYCIVWVSVSAIDRAFLEPQKLTV